MEKFSTRINGYPSGLDIIVYLRYNDMEKKEPVCKIEFIAEEYGKNYNIKNDSDKFRLYLDGEDCEKSVQKGAGMVKIDVARESGRFSVCI